MVPIDSVLESVFGGTCAEIVSSIIRYAANKRGNMFPGLKGRKRMRIPHQGSLLGGKRILQIVSGAACMMLAVMAKLCLKG